MEAQKILMRDEKDTDYSVISDVTKSAFETIELSNHTEQFIIEALRAANALTISLVAEVNGRVVGHIAFSPVTMSDGTKDWYGLGPVSVYPDFQRKGIGKALIQVRKKSSHASDAVFHDVCIKGVVKICQFYINFAPIRRDPRT